LAHEIAAGVLRNRRTLDAHLKPLVTATWRHTPADLKDLLRIGAYQLTILTRIPAYAAVETTVDLAKAACGAKPAGLVNAVLRKLAAAGRHLPAVSGGTSLAQRYSHPEWLVQRWLRRFGPRGTEALLRYNNNPPPLTLQPVRWSLNQLRTALEDRGIRTQDAPFGSGLTISGVQVAELPGFAQGAFIAQDATQARLLQFAAISEGATVWDACAAPGGKTALLAKGRKVLASDLRRERLPLLLDTLRRVALTVPVVLADARTPPLPTGTFDAVLVDAPCTATGTIARHPDARWRLSPDRITRLQQLQMEILEGAAPIVRPGGLLVYLTCSLEPEENEIQIDRFLDRHRDYTREGEDQYIFPPDAGTDGGYGARLRRAT
jgi:16S rRNA (cytosine967-C5)-methyltransferase